jgi:hypothetical protein
MRCLKRIHLSPGDVAPAVRLNWSLALKEDQTMKRKRFTRNRSSGFCGSTTWVRRQPIETRDQRGDLLQLEE